MKKFQLLFIVLILSVNFSFSQTTNNSSYILAIEGNQVYLDLNSSNCKIGCSLSVIKEGDYFTHPISGKKIKKKDEVISTLEVTEVNSDYSVARAYPASSLQALKKGMRAFELSSEESNNYSLLRKSLSVHPLKVTSATGGYLGIYISDLLTENLFAQDKYKIIDRETLGLQMDEVALNQDGFTDSKLMGVGRMAGVDYLITGTMHEPDVVQVSSGIPLKGALQLAETISGQNLGSKYVSDVKFKKLKAIVKITLRVVDIRTGEIKFICTEMQEAVGKSDISLEKSFLGGLKVQGGSTAFVNTVTGQAVQKALGNLSGYIDGYFDGSITDKSFKGNYIDAKNKSKKKKSKEEFQFEYAINDRIHFYDESNPGSNKYIGFREGKIIGLHQKRKQYQVKLDDGSIELINSHLVFQYNPNTTFERQIVKDKEFCTITYHLNDNVTGKVRNQIILGSIKHILPERNQVQIQYRNSEEKEFLSIDSFFPYKTENELELNPSQLKCGKICLLFLHGTFYYAKVIEPINANGTVKIEYDFEEDGIVKSKTKNISYKHIIGLKST
ncbi:CsgG/HfaB family protein [Marinifilum flexuosum]|uniref:Curli production assembly/transport component CsgG n=1 Tax=Marinifilum flexuosum TaxID=1117708 RepID=A0A419X5Z8_9BACT|nr:CsgG/HfaB family protein [Marinifilum flexuosum]RKE03156.1 Curli production assembly/transport component CsgG [Marinifilum flexuosum]